MKDDCSCGSPSPALHDIECPKYRPEVESGCVLCGIVWRKHQNLLHEYVRPLSDHDKKVMEAFYERKGAGPAGEGRPLPTLKEALDDIYRHLDYAVDEDREWIWGNLLCIINEVFNDRDSANQQLGDCKLLLKRIEWNGRTFTGTQVYRCPECSYTRPQHITGCKLDEQLKG